MQNNKDAGQQDDDKLQPAMTAVMLGRDCVCIVLDVSHQLEGTTSLEQRPWGEGSGRQRSGEVDRRRYAGIGKERNMPAWDRLPWAHTIASNHQPKDAGPAAKKPRGKMVKNTEILGEFRRTLSRFSAAN
jgi:hypothetical protein